MPKNINAYIVSLGCPKNFVDTEIIAASLLLAGIGISNSPENADIYLINTCAFIPPARKEAESFIKKAVKWKSVNPEQRKIIVCGCLVQREKENALIKKIPDVDFWAGIDEVEKIGRHITEILKKREAPKIIKHEIPFYLYKDSTPRLQLTPPHYAYLKISDGCSNKCSYCSIPSIRGNLRCRDKYSVVKEAENLIKNGCKELILTAQDSTAYVSGTENITDILKSLDSLEGDFWIRLMYAHPAHVTDSLIETFANAKHLLPYIDLPLQHISDKILSSMRRRIESRKIKELLKRIRSSIPGIAIRTTFLVGYPGETEDDFKLLRDFVRGQRFERLGVFTYYPEDETDAAKLPGKINPETAKKRREQIMEIQSGISLENNLALKGETIEVLVDKKERGLAAGRSYRDAPDIDNIILIEKSRDIKAGVFIKVKITSVDSYSLKAIPIQVPANRRFSK